MSEVKQGLTPAKVRAMSFWTDATIDAKLARIGKMRDPVKRKAALAQLDADVTAYFRITAHAGRRGASQSC